MTQPFMRQAQWPAATTGSRIFDLDMDETTKQASIPEQAILEQLDRILRHEEFHATDKMRDFLRFVVEETLAGNARQLKGFTVAREVFGRDEDFDAAQDPVVRIQAGRLRRAMERYYLTAGRRDPVLIKIPKGGYVPVFTAGPVHVSETGDRATDEVAFATKSWPSILVLPFETVAGSSETEYLGTGLATELCIGLGSCPEFRVMLSGTQVPEIPAEHLHPDFIVRGMVQQHGEECKVMVQLLCATTGEQLWVDSLKSTLDGTSLITFQEQTAQTIAARIASVHGAIFRSFSLNDMRIPYRKAGSYEAVLKGYSYHQRVDAPAFALALEALEAAHGADPECGLVCTLLSLLYVDNLSMEFIDIERTPLQKTRELAREGARLLPENTFSRLMLSRVHLLDGKLEAGRAEAEAAYALNPDSLMFMDAIGYMLILLGDWDRGEQLILRAVELNPFYRLFTRSALWVNAFRQGHYERALAEAEMCAGVIYFWGPLSRTATLGQLGHPGAGRAVRELLDLKPDFAAQGRTLIERYIKFPEITERIIEGLYRAGLDLKRRTV
jgi:adenylate cyclase